MTADTGEAETTSDSGVASYQHMTMLMEQI